MRKTDTFKPKIVMTITEQDKQFMREAIRLSAESVRRGGGPFGAVIARGGELIPVPQTG